MGFFCRDLKGRRACQMAGRADFKVPISLPTSRAGGVVLRRRHRYFSVLSGRLSDIVCESMTKPRNVNDCMGSRIDFSQFMVNPRCGKRVSAYQVFAFDSSMEEPRIKKII